MPLFNPSCVAATLYSGCTKRSLRTLQLIQDSAARIMTKSLDHISPELFSLHWLTIKFKVEFRIPRLAYEVVHGLAASYSADLIEPYQSLSKALSLVHFVEIT